MRVWDADDGEDLMMFRGPAPLEDLAVAPQGVVAAVDRSGRLFLFSFQNLEMHSPRTTAAYLYRFATQRFDRRASVSCPWCGTRFNVEEAKVGSRFAQVFRFFGRRQSFDSVDESRTSKIEGPITCPNCHNLMTLHPFVADRGERLRS